MRLRTRESYLIRGMVAGHHGVFVLNSLSCKAAHLRLPPSSAAVRSDRSISSVEAVYRASETHALSRGRYTGTSGEQVRVGEPGGRCTGDRRSPRWQHRSRILFSTGRPFCWPSRGGYLRAAVSITARVPLSLRVPPRDSSGSARFSRVTRISIIAEVLRVKVNAVELGKGKLRKSMVPLLKWLTHIRKL